MPSQLVEHLTIIIQARVDAVISRSRSDDHHWDDRTIRLLLEKLVSDQLHYGRFPYPTWADQEQMGVACMLLDRLSELYIDGFDMGVPHFDGFKGLQSRSRVLRDRAVAGEAVVVPPRSLPGTAPGAGH